MTGRTASRVWGFAALALALALAASALAPLSALARTAQRTQATHARSAPKRRHPRKPPQDPNVGRAQAAYRALQKYLYIPAYGLYRGSANAPYSHLWPFSQTLAATVSMTELPLVGKHYTNDFHDRMSGLGHYWEGAATPPAYSGNVGPPLGSYGTIGYDDNEWVALELVRRYRYAKNIGVLRRAEQLFDLSVSGWDRNPAHACPGGVLFSASNANSDRNTVTNAPAVELGARLFAITHNAYYLTWGKRFYDWVRTCLASGGGLYQDHIAFNGDRDQTIWSYNQGTMVGAGVLLYEVTHHRGYLSNALSNARAALSYFGRTRLTGDPPFFVAIFLDNLALLDQVHPNPAYMRTARWYGDWAWANIRDPATNVFAFDSGGGQVLEQAAMVRVYATLAGAKP